MDSPPPPALPSYHSPNYCHSPFPHLRGSPCESCLNRSVVPIALRRKPERESPLTVPCRHQVFFPFLSGSCFHAFCPLRMPFPCLAPLIYSHVSRLDSGIRVKWGARPPHPLRRSGLGFPLCLPPLLPPSDWAVQGYLAVSRVNTLESTVCFVKKINKLMLLCA